MPGLSYLKVSYSLAVGLPLSGLAAGLDLFVRRHRPHRFVAKNSPQDIFLAVSLRSFKIAVLSWGHIGHRLPVVKYTRGGFVI